VAPVSNTPSRNLVDEVALPSPREAFKKAGTIGSHVSVETELDVARQSYALGEWSLLYLPHPDFPSCGSIDSMGKTPGQALQIVG
jgi:hypothetical protein